MKKTFILAVAAFSLCLTAPSYAYWMWSPELGKWVNPKKSAKDTPQEQFDWAMSFYQQKDLDRAIGEFEKLADSYPSSPLAAEGVYYTGVSWQEKNDLNKAADNFQKVIDKYPHSDRIKDAIQREFEIAGLFADGTRIKVLGIPALSGQQRALELYTHIVKNAPFGSFGDQAQYKMGEIYTAQAEYVEAQKAFQAVVDEYPNSPLVPQAKYQIAESSLRASKKAQYNDEYAQRAIDEFEGFKKNYPESAAAQEADASIRTLRAKKAENVWETAAFYEKQQKYASARVYFEEVVSQYPETEAAAKSRASLEAIQGLDNVSNPTGGPIKSLGAAVGGVTGGVGKAVGGVGGGVGKALAGVGETTGKAISGTGAAIKGVGEGTGKVISGTGQALSGTGEAIVGAGKSTGQAIGGAGQNVTKVILPQKGGADVS